MARDDYDEPFGWWGWHWQPPQPLSVIDLIDAGSFDAGMLGLVWMLLARRASVIVGAEPPMAGKTTTLTALLDFLPPATRTLYMHGHYETFDFLKDPTVVPEQTYLLANEMSDHLAVYFWGARVGRLFSLLPEGFAFGSTMHAETVDEVLDVLSAWPLRVPPALLSRLNLVINLVLRHRGGRTIRRCSSINLVLPDEAPRGVRTVSLAHWDAEADVFVPDYETSEAVEALACWAGMAPEAWAAEHGRRTAHLQALQARGSHDIPAVRRSLAGFARSEAAG